MRKKGLLENIFSTVVLVILFIIVGISLFSHTTKDIIHNYESAEQVFLEESYSNSLNSVLEVDEGITGEPMSRLVAKRVFYRQEVFDYGGQQVNITHEFKTLLDKVFGKETYFVKVEPVISNLSLIFVFDGSDSMKEERQVLSDTLSGLIDTLKYESNLSVKEAVYILNPNEDICKIFTEKDISCEHVKHNQLYLPIPQKCASAAPNADYRAKYCIVAPYLHSKWEVNNRQADWQKGKTDIDRTQYYKSDWGTGITYALHRSTLSLANVNIVFPISEELSTSSFGDECFDDPYDSKGWKWVYCGLCLRSDNDATKNRANRSIQNVVDMSNDIINDVIYPIYSYEEPCDYEYTQARHDNLDWYFNVDPGVGPSRSKAQTYCDISGRCEGCTKSGAQGVNFICLHPEVQDTILAHMDELASATGGSVVQISDVHQLPDMINTQVTQTLNDLIFTVGQEQNKSRLGFERYITLPGAEGNFARLRLYKYLD